MQRQKGVFYPLATSFAIGQMAVAFVKLQKSKPCNALCLTRTSNATIILRYFVEQLIRVLCYSLLAQSRNTPLLPPKTFAKPLFAIISPGKREVENNAYADSWGVKEVYYGIYASSE